MDIISFEPLAKTMLIESITADQKYISPSKGFCCFHRLFHGGDSCSNYVKPMLSQSILDFGFWILDLFRPQGAGHGNFGFWILDLFRPLFYGA